MEFCEGKELLTILEEKNIMSEKDSAGIIYKLLEGINHIHSVHVAHRDLKPENIMIDKNGNPKIIDFGLSKDT
jgi:serine/threonine protein kinase